MAESADDGAPLFAGHATLELMLTMPLGELRPGEELPEPLAGSIRLLEGGVEKVFNVNVDTRGHSRLTLCDLPPLKVDFDRSEVAGSVFAGQNKLKLVTHCQSSRKFYRYLEQEYGLYKSYNILSEDSFRVRRLQVTYRDSAGRIREKTRPAFFIESDREVAKRLGAREVVIPKINVADLAPQAITTLALFHFMIGNTDWSLLKGRGNEPCCHNGLLLEKGSGQLVIVPYDFDQAGLIDADYALPARALGIRTVRQRLFRGLCTGEDYFASSLALLRSKRADIEAQFPTAGVLRRPNRRAQDYLAGFYDLAAAPDARRAAINAQCRGNPGLWSSQ